MVPAAAPPLPRSAIAAALAVSTLVAVAHMVVLADTIGVPLLGLGPERLLLLALNWWKWAAALPLFAWLVRRVPLTARLRSVGLHAAVALLATTVHLGLTVAFGALLDRGEPAGLVTVWLNRMRLEGLLTVWLNRLDPHLVIYAAIVAALSAREAAWRSVAEATRSARLDEQLARAQLEVPSLQLQPHFLFNALNALAELAHEDREDARRMLRDLRGLLALSFEWATRTEVALGEELDFVRAYAGIQGRRFRGLSFRMHADEDALSARVPPLLLQPLVENAIRHGLGRRGGRVEVRAWREAEALRIDVLDDGGGLAGGSPAADGLGLRNTRARLAHLYGPDQSLEIEGRSEGGVLARLVLPFRTEERAA